ncbi:unnamed protein product [Calicophoron daubneyi]|uniref:Peptidase C1A papain C-terminal domain-containing protein n=1 Tax=Calicophoron daubneyi TaxID=300641 RepID=A0AAV2U106_CALDB
MSAVILFALFYVGFATASPIEDELNWNISQIGAGGALIPTPEMIAEVGYKEVVYDENEVIPEEFDARQKWPHCVSLKTIWNQGECGSCWAVSSASAMGDRYCIRNQGNVILSAYDIMSCCDSCPLNGPCGGGYPIRAFQHWNMIGVVTGGPAQCSGCTCYRYTGDNLFSCDHTCRADYWNLYEYDLTRGRPAKFLVNNVEVIQREIMTNGPVVATFDVYSDFVNIGTGVYIHRGGQFRFSHCVRVIGWGVQYISGQRVPYWLVANSWGTQWGDEGLFRILRGQNHCQIESYVVAD